MNRRMLIANMAMGTALLGVPGARSLARGVPAGDPRQKVRALLKSIETGDPAAASVLDPHTYIQHNPMVGDGVAGFQAMIARIPRGATKVNSLRIFRDGDFVFAHSEYAASQSVVGFDIFRFERGLIVEHWDNLQPKPDRPNPSGRTMIDGTTVASDLHKTEGNKAVVKGFVADVLTQRRLERAAAYIDPRIYLQHNPHVGDGMEAMIAAFRKLDETGTPHRYHATPLILGEGNFVLAASEGVIGDVPTAYYDLFRLAGGRIVEHWDVVSSIPPRAEWKNANAKF